MNLSPDRIIAYFQPILSADTKEVYAYEALGRYIDDDGTIKSLGPFFTDPDSSSEDVLKVDRIVRQYAIKKYAEEKRSEYLFINIRLSWLLPYADKPEEIITLQLAKEFSIAPEKLVIEITEEEFKASEENVIRVIAHYRKMGCRIALDDYGKDASNIERLITFLPDIIKIDMDYVHKSESSYHYREYLRTLAAFAESVGIEVLYEGVETERQLDICLSSKGRFYQGFFIATPQPSMRNISFNRPVFSQSIENSCAKTQNDSINLKALRNSIDVQVERFLLENPFDYEKLNNELYLRSFAERLTEVKLFYMCDRQGNQLTCIIERQTDKLVCYDCSNKNWAWRGYFHEALRHFAMGRKNCLSYAYRDFTTKEEMYTYSYALSDNVFLFADIVKNTERTETNAT